jgi:hypothetical protein
VVVEFQVSINAAVVPKHIDFAHPWAGTMKGIFRFDDDGQLLLCRSGFDKTRPAEFSADKASDTSVLVYRRATPVEEEDAKWCAPETLLQAGSLWKGPLVRDGKVEGQVTLHVTKRAGMHFEGTILGLEGGLERDGPNAVSGKISSGKIELVFPTFSGKYNVPVWFKKRTLCGSWRGTFKLDKVSEKEK